MNTCSCFCGCQNKFEDISDNSLGLLIALSERKVSHDKTICNGCRFDKHRKRRFKPKNIAVVE